jgi:hypothetical protein
MIQINEPYFYPSYREHAMLSQKRGYNMDT